MTLETPEPDRSPRPTLTRVLLRLYPPSFRKDVGHAFIGDVAPRASELAASQMGVRVGFWLVRLTARFTNAVAAWVDR